MRGDAGVVWVSVILSIARNEGFSGFFSDSKTSFSDKWQYSVFMMMQKRLGMEVLQCYLLSRFSNTFSVDHVAVFLQ